jgi:lysophospholipase L1-like esterase
VGARLHDVVGQLTFVRRLVYEDMVLSVGANDATHLTSLASYRTDMRKLAAYLATRPPGHTFVFTAPDMSLVPALPIGYRTLVGMRAAAENRILREEMPSTVIIVDIYNQGKLDPKVDPWLYAEDQFHPSDKGYAIWASVLQKAQHP